MATWEKTGVSDKVATPKAKDVGGRVVQHHYVRAQVRDINLHKNDRLMNPVLAWLGQRMGGLRPNYAPDRVKIEQALATLKRRLQNAELTINFKAWAWFAEPNEYSTYEQMYERSLKPVNDDQGGARKELRITDTARHNDDHRVMGLDGLRNNPKWAGVTRIMDTGGITKHESGHHTANNPKFAPKSRPVFAGLNYGRRPHGSTQIFGDSQLVLSDKFKINAIYYPVDTCMNEMDGERRVHADHSHMVSYDLLPAVCPMAHSMMQEDLYKSCVLQNNLEDVKNILQCNLYLLEAHLYEPPVFSSSTIKVRWAPRLRQ